jgi:hypothetical protein
MVHRLSFVAFAAVVTVTGTLTTACSRRSNATTGTTTTTSASPAATATETTSGSSRRFELEGRVGYGAVWGNDDRARRAAKAVQNALVDEGGIPRSEIGVAVQRLSGRTVAVVKLKYLKDEDREDRKDLAHFIHYALAEQVGNDEIVFGVRGAMLYGTIAWAKGSGELDMKVGKSVPAEKLERALQP